MDPLSLHEASHAYVTRQSMPKNIEAAISRQENIYTILTEEVEAPEPDVLLCRAIAGSLGERIVELWPTANNNGRTMQNLIQELYVNNRFWTDRGAPDREYAEALADDEMIKSAIFQTTPKLIHGFITDKQFFETIQMWIARSDLSDRLSF